MNTGRFRHKKIYFSQVSNVVLRDKKLSLKAKGLYALIQSFITIEDFVLYKSHLMKQCKEGRDSFNSGWNELKESGYLVQYKLKDDKNRIYYEYELLDEPCTNNPYTEIPHTENPHTAFPHTEKSLHGNPVPINNTDINNTDINNINIIKQQQEELLVVFENAFGNKPNKFIVSDMDNYIKLLDIESVTIAIEIAATNNKGYDYARGVLRTWIDLGLKDSLSVVKYLESKTIL